MARSVLTRCAVAAVLLLTGGCFGSGAGDEGTTLDVVEFLNETSESQREILQDGVVTFPEYERATLATIECIEAGGIEGVSVVGPHPRDGDPRFLEWGTEWEGSIPVEEYESFSERLDDLMFGCEDEYLNDVGRVWEFQNLLSPEERERERPLVIQCLQKAGIGLSDSASTEDVYQAVAEADAGNEQVRECHREHAEFFRAGAG